MSDKDTLSRLKEINSVYGMFHDFGGEWTDDTKFLFSAKDNLTSIGFETCAGSKILEGYRPVFDATAIAKMKAAGGKLVGKTNMDEFGFGTFSANSAFEVPKNPFDLDRSCGGSSGGSACAAAVLAVVFISSEIEEMLRTCDRMVVMRDGAKVGELSGNEMNQSSIMSTIAVWQ